MDHIGKNSLSAEVVMMGSENVRHLASRWQKISHSIAWSASLNNCEKFLFQMRIY